MNILNKTSKYWYALFINRSLRGYKNLNSVRTKIAGSFYSVIVISPFFTVMPVLIERFGN